MDKTGLVHLFEEKQSTDEEVAVLLDKEATGILDLKPNLDPDLESVGPEAETK